MNIIRILYGLCLATLMAGCCNPPLVELLDVPPLPQQASNWCWAASGQMTMKYFGHDVAQCTEANNRFGLTSCCNNNSGNCDQGGWPEYEKYGFTADHTTDQPLSWAQVQSQIHCAKKPVAMTWHWTGGSGHMMALRGYMIVNNVQWVVINDPLPAKDLQHLAGGTLKIITYNDYVSGAYWTHWDDYYNITYKGR